MAPRNARSRTRLRKRSATLAPAARRLRVEALEDRRVLAAFTVTSLDDAGPGTLREAITLANATAAADTIDFAVTGVIHIGSQLPTITAPLTINGPGAELLTIDAGNGADGEFGTHDGWRHFEIDDGIDNTIYSESFNGNGSLDGTAEDTQGVVWAADSAFYASGGVDREIQGSALLPFNAEANRTYELSATLVNSTENRLALGFTEQPLATSGEELNGDAFSGLAARAWASLRDSADATQRIELFAGPGQTNQIADQHRPISSHDVSEFKILLDTTGDGSYYTVDYQFAQSDAFVSINDGGRPTPVHDAIDSLRYVGLSHIPAGGTPMRSPQVARFQLSSRINVAISDLKLTGGDANGSIGAISNTETLTLSHVTIAGNSGWYSIANTGDLTVTTSTIANNSGGGIASFGSTVLTDVTVAHNHGIGLDNGGTANIKKSRFDSNAGWYGGAIQNSGRLSIANSTLSGNSAGAFGGGIYSLSGYAVTITESFISGNSAGSAGGGVLNLGPISIEDSTISDNSADFGGGLANGGLARISGSTFLNNSATTSGGGISNDYRDSLTITNSTLSGNVAGFGGGISNAGTAAVSSTTFSGNAADTGGGLANRNWGSATLTNTVVANSARGDDTYIGGGISGAYNLVEDGSDGLPDTITGDPRLGPLADNGGLTPTHGLLPGSPALDAGDLDADVSEVVLLDFLETVVLEFDQRGAPFSRIENGRIDIGAFEGVVAEPTPGDANLDGVVDLLDLDLLGAHFGDTGAYFSLGDFNGDHIVNLLDLDLLGAHYETHVPAVTSGVDDAIAAIDAALDLLEAEAEQADGAAARGLDLAADAVNDALLLLLGLGEGTADTAPGEDDEIPVYHHDGADDALDNVAHLLPDFLRGLL